MGQTFGASGAGWPSSGAGIMNDDRLKLIARIVNGRSDGSDDVDPTELDTATDYERLMDAPALLVCPDGALVSNNLTGE